MGGGRKKRCHFVLVLDTLGVFVLHTVLVSV